MHTTWRNIRSISRQIVRPRTFLVLFLLLACTQLFWHPVPNRVEVTLSGLEQEPAFRSMQLYYQYDLPTMRGFKEYQSQKKLIHPTKSQLKVVFNLPDLQRPGPLRLDFGMGSARLYLHRITFNYHFLWQSFHLGTLEPLDISSLWEPNDSVRVLETGKDSLLLEVEGADPYSILRLPIKLWQQTLPDHELITIRLIRAFFIFGSGLLILLGYRFAKKEWLAFAGTDKTPVWNVCAPVCFLLLIALIGYLVYRPFLNFQLLYLFADVANDSVAAFFSMYLHLSDYLRTEGWPLWSYSLGVGGSISSQLFDPFILLQVSLPPEKLGFGFGWIQFLKLLLAAGFFFIWFRLLNLGRYGAAFGALSLSFSAHMIVRGNWLHYSTEVVVVAFTLVAIELFITRRFWQLVPFALVLLVMRGVFYTYVWTIILLGYVFCRLFLYYRDDFRNRLEALGKLILLYCLGLVMSCAVFLPSLYSILNSGRISGSESGGGFFSKMLTLFTFSINEPKHYLSSLYGLLGADILGRANFYSGWGNYLEGPHLYAGLLCLLLLPQVFLKKDFRLRVVALLFLLTACAYIFIPWVRFFLNGFAGSYYKTSSFWISIFIVCLASLSLDNLVRKKILNIPLLILTLAALFVSLWYLKYSPFIRTYISEGEDNIVYFQAGILLLCYFFILLCLHTRRLRSPGLLLLLILLCTEAYTFSKGSSQDRMALRGDTMATKGFYFDEAFDAANQIQVQDNGFYRIEKSKPSVSFNDALAQSFFGVKSYNSFNSAAYLRFLGPGGFNVNYEHKIAGSTSYITGLDQRAVLEALLSVKYYLSPRQEKFISIVPSNYQSMGQIGSWQILKNKNFIPFGIVYHTLATEEFASGLPESERDLLALEAAIVTEETMETLNLPRRTAANPIWSELLPQSENTAGFDDYFSRQAASLAATAMELTDFRQNRFSATASLTEPGLLFLSIPAEKGWRFYINDRPVEPVRTHFGFIGLPLEKGAAEIRGEYFTPLLGPGILLSLLGLLLYCLLLLLAVFSSKAKSLVTPPHLSENTFKAAI